MLCNSKAPYGYATNNTDCNDNDAGIHSPKTYYVDNDHDGYGSKTTALVCSSKAPAGYSTNNSDCDDNNAAVYPGAAEICGNAKDDNCNGQVDEGCAVCQNATALTTTNITSSTAKLNWTAPANPLGWEVDYKKSGAASWISLLLPGTGRSITLSSLSFNQTYSWRIRALCGKTWTDFSATAVFKTLSTGIRSGNESRPIPETDISLKNLEVRALPNPTSTNFTITLKGNGQSDIIKMTVVDLYGRMIEQRILANDQTITIGNNYISGVYIVRFMQGAQSQQLKLIKISQ